MVTIRIWHCKVALCTLRSCVFFTCVFAFMFVTVNVITIHSYQTINTTPLSDPAVVQSTVTAHSNIPHVNSSGHQQSRTARKTLEKQTQLIFPSIFGGSFDPYQYIQSQISSFNKTGDSFRRHYFNQTASDLIGYKRPLWDTRHEKCKRVYSTNTVTSVSVIICFHNEARSALLRTIHSVLDRTPDSVLKEIILVDDFSDNARDGYELKSIPKIKLIRLNDRQGLIRARLIGMRHAQGEILVFLDSHCEATAGWIQPLVARILECRNCIVSPVIDIINKNSMKYITSQVNIKGGFDHNLFFKWVNLSPIDIERRRLDVVAPISSPAIAGGLFAVDKRFFIELGSYDEEMDIWGGENIELSMRTWMCGAQLEIMPCSRVGHIFRSTMPYNFGKGKTYLSTVVKNLCRTAEVWMDESKSLFYSEMPLAKEVDFGNITDRQTLRKNLHCKSFQWYIDNIYPEFISNYTSPKYVQLVLEQHRKCVSMVTDHYGRHVLFKHCELIVMGPSNDQIWELTSDGQIKHSNSCLTVAGGPSALSVPLHSISIEDCISGLDLQLFTITEAANNHYIITHSLTGLCMAGLSLLQDELTVGLDNCTSSNSGVNLKWTLRNLL